MAIAQVVHPWNMHAGQWRVWDAVWNKRKRRIVVHPGRRWGKSDLKVMLHLQGAWQDHLAGVRNGVSWNVERTYDLTKPMWRAFLRLAPPGWITKTIGNEEHPVALIVGGTQRIEFKSADHPERLVSVGLRRCSVDECGIINPRVVLESIMPTMADFPDSMLWLFGVPKGKNWYYREAKRGWSEDYPECATFGGSSYDNPFIDRATVHQIAESMPRGLRQQEIWGRFIDDAGGVFQGVRRLAILPVSLQEPNPAHHYILGVDWAKHSDFTVATLIDVTARCVAGWYREQKRSWPEMRGVVLDMARYFNVDTIFHDASGVGDTQHDELCDAGFRVVGVKTADRMQQHQLVQNLRRVIEDGLITYPPIEVMLKELEDFGVEVTNTGLIRYTAPEGEHDDCVISLGLACLGITGTAQAHVHTIEPQRRVWHSQAAATGRGAWFARKGN